MGNLNLDIADPLFIVDINSRQIIQANDSALSRCVEINPVGAQFDEVVHTREASFNHIPAFLGGKWYMLEKQMYKIGTQQFQKMILKKPASVPDPETLQILRNMIAVLLHRLRSPLTGMQGYLELMQEDFATETGKKRLGILNDGVDQLFDILDELELLYNTPVNTDDINEPQTLNPGNIIDEVLINYPPEIRDNITVSTPAKPAFFDCNPTNLKNVLSILVENAIEHLAGEEKEISIDVRSAHEITISHGGNPIPENISRQLFYPFVTSKANNLGIGLTLAMLYARQLNGTIYLSQNSSEEGITFTFCLPPTKNERSGLKPAKL